MGLWYDETFDGRVRLGLKLKRTLYTAQSPYQLVEVFETEAYGRALAVDGIFMTSEEDEHFYHEMIVHPALLTAPSVEEVLIIGGGDGGTAREVLRHPGVKRVVLCEIDAEVIKACREFLPGHGAWDDPRLEVRIGDGIEFLRNGEQDSYDVVILDGSDPVGPAKGLFNESFYRDVDRALRNGGVFALQTEGPILLRSLFLDTVRTLRRVFRRAHPYFGPVPLYGAGIWSWTFCSESTSPLDIDESRAAAIEEQCKYYNRDIHRAAFAMPQGLKREIGPGPALPSPAAQKRR